MLTSIQSLSISNPALFTAFNDIFVSTDLARSEHSPTPRRFPLDDLNDRDIDKDWGILGAMHDGEKNWTEG